MLIISVILIYFISLLVLSRIVSSKTSNDIFFHAERKSPWYLVAFGMIGASISGVTFISVPGMVIMQDMTYMQMCLGFVVGYFVVAFLLLPLYYRLRLTTIYSYLGKRLGQRSYTTGASFFFLSKMSGAVVRFYIACILLHNFALKQYGIPFSMTVPVLVLFMWIYTHRGGIKTLVWTDTMQTAVMFITLILIITAVISHLDMSLPQAVSAICSHPHSRIFVFDDWHTTQNFFKQFLSGIFVVIVMTGLDQDMMQKSLTCPSLRDSQKNLCSYAFAFIPANLLFLSLGILLMMLAAQTGTPLPAKGDDLLPMFAATGLLGQTVVAFFAIGLIASAFSSADSALTALVTSVCIDILRRPEDERTRKAAHIIITAVFVVLTILFSHIGSSSVINAIYIMCSYTYGPLLGLFSFAIFTQRSTNERFTPFICILSPIACYALDTLSQHLWNYHFGYELLMLNGLLTFCGLLATSRRKA